MRGVRSGPAAAWLASRRRLINMRRVLAGRDRPVDFAPRPASGLRRAIIMRRVLSVAAERFPIAGIFTISRGSKTEAEVICLRDRRRRHRAAAANACRTAATAKRMESVAAAIESVRGAIEDGCDRARAAAACCRPAPRATRSTARCGTSRPSFRGKRVAAQVCNAAPAADRHRLYAVARRRPRRWRRRRAPMPSGPCSRSRSAAKATSRASGRWSRLPRTAGIILDANEGWTRSQLGGKPRRGRRARRRADRAAACRPAATPSCARSPIPCRSAPTRACTPPPTCLRSGASTMPSTSSSTRPAG